MRLRFRGGCAGNPAEEVSKPCDKSGFVTDTCLVVIQNSYQLGILSSSMINSTYIINPDEYVNFDGQILTGTRLGHDDLNAVSSTQIINGGGATWTTGGNGATWTTGGNSATWTTGGNGATWTTGGTVYQTGGQSFSWNGVTINSNGLEYAVVNGRTVQGVYINGSFVEGKY